VLLNVALDGSKGSHLLGLDAWTMKEIGRTEVGLVIGVCFHRVHVKAWIMVVMRYY
jgi:hypothetical protein